ncbi:MAG: nuclear transport factor 2 family protein [Sphingobium sp.]|nr:nuclear transport factor 2 family protein [Sphingobium sp.]
MERWSDRRRVEQAIALHNIGRDRRDAGVLAKVYHADARLWFGTDPVPAGAWIDQICTSLNTLASHHRTSNVVVRIDGDHARSESCCIARVEIQEQGIRRFLGGRYLDRHEQRDGRWAIAERRFVYDWNIDLPIAESAFADALRGSADAGEPSASADALFLHMRAIDRGETGDSPALAMSFHALTSVRFAAAGDRATGTGDLLAIAGDGDADHARVGRLHADAMLHDGTWSIVGCRFDEGWSGTRPSTFADLPFTRGRRDRDDPAYLFWR